MKKTNETTGGENSRRKTRNDIIFIATLLSVVLIAVLGILLFRTEGDTVTVTVDGRLFGEYPLGEDREVEIKNGNGYNLLVIEGGKAYVKSANCPDGICSSHRPVGYGGESIICLPNKVVVEVHARGWAPHDAIV